MLPRPYIGITGFMTGREVTMAAEEIPTGATHDLMAGILVSSKTLRGEQNKRPNRYPTIENANRIPLFHRRVFTVVHYNTKEPDTLGEQLREIQRCFRSLIEGIQLNMAWPNPLELIPFCVKTPQYKIILQIGAWAFEKIDNSPQKLVERIKGRYSGLVDYVLLDMSGGEGIVMDRKNIDRYLEALYGAGVHEQVRIGIAGGLDPENVGEVVRPFATRYPNLCVDAEGRIRDENDHLDIAKAKQYLRAAYATFQS